LVQEEALLSFSRSVEGADNANCMPDAEPFRDKLRTSRKCKTLIVPSLASVDSAKIDCFFRGLCASVRCRTVRVTNGRRLGTYACATSDTGPVDTSNRRASREHVMLYM
jgi:hypothetical protein